MESEVKPDSGVSQQKEDPTMGNAKERDKGKLGVHLLVIAFGVTSWSIMNGLWVELPILVAHLPEGWTLPSYLTIVAQFGNIGPVLFSLLTYLLPHRKLETGASLVVVGGLALCALVYGFLWRETATVGGREVSVAVLTLTFCQASLAATCSICYLAFMAHLRARYMSGIFIGMGLSGLIPAFAAMGQGMGDVTCLPSAANSTANHSLTQAHDSSGEGPSIQSVPEEPAFSVQAFFSLLCGLGLVSLSSLVLLVWHPYCGTEHVDTETEENCQLMDGLKDAKPDPQAHHELPAPHGKDNESSLVGLDDKGNNSREITNNENISTVVALGPLSENGQPHNQTSELHEVLSPAKQTYEHSNDPPGDADDVEGLKVNVSQLGKYQSWYLLALLVWINVLQTSYVLAIQVYSSLPYGLYFYNGVTRAENIVDPVACLVCMFVTARSTRVISGLTLLGSLFTAYIITVAGMSPHPFLEGQHDTLGGALVLMAWVMCTLLMVFSKVSIASVMREQGRTSLLWTGASTQLGAFIGAVLAYVMINHLHLFKEGPWCQ